MEKTGSASPHTRTSPPTLCPRPAIPPSPTLHQVSYLVVYGNLPTAEQSSRWSEAVMRHSALPVAVEQTIAALPHDAHPMGTILTGLCALSTLHPEQNPALAGQNIYASKEVQDKQVVRLIGKIPTLAALAYHRASGRKPAQPNQNLGYAEVRVWSCVCDGVRWRWRCCPEFLLLIVSVSVCCCCPCHEQQTYVSARPPPPLPTVPAPYPPPSRPPAPTHPGRLLPAELPVHA